MSKIDFVRTLEGTGNKLRFTMDHWRGHSDADLTEVLGGLTSKLEKVTETIRSSSEPVVPPETVAAIWQLAEAIDEAARTTGESRIVEQVGVATTGLRAFYFSRGILVDSDARITFKQNL